MLHDAMQVLQPYSQARAAAQQANPCCARVAPAHIAPHLARFIHDPVIDFPLLAPKSHYRH
jgi:hypothetical protein